MERVKRVHKERMELAARAHERWQGLKLDEPTTKRAITNRDGPLPSPAIGPITPLQQQRFTERQRLRGIFESTAYRDLRVTVERQVGATLDFVDLPPNEQALKAGRPVVRIVTLGAPGLVPEGFATGFLVAPNLLLTNHHVFRTADEAEGVGAQFLYERVQGGLREGMIFELDPARFFINHKGLDYAVVAVKPTSVDGAPLSQFQYLPLIAAQGKSLKGDPVNIIQHPEGRPKQYATVNNHLLDLRDDGFLLYETDTLEGSSGSPVFNEHWETIGLHHCGVPQIENGELVTRDGRRVPLDAEVADSDLIWVANEGVRVSALVASLSEQRLDRSEQQVILEKLIATTNDPLRLVAEKSPLVTGSAGVGNPFNTLPSAAMAQNVFQFSGPVTILVNPPAAGVATPGPAPLTQGPFPAQTVDLDFRERALKFDEDYRARAQFGYRSSFLEDWDLPVPTVTDPLRGELLLDDQGEPWVIPYHHYSLMMNRQRRLLAWAASNVDYSPDARSNTKTRKEYGGENWRLDPRVALEAPGLQIEDADFYAPARKIDRGHIVRREDSAWGADAVEAEFGNSDTYHWTNCTPQSEAFNQSGKSGVWGQFEAHIQKEVNAVGNRMSVFAGPVLNPDDPEHGYGRGTAIKVPMEFWKVVVCVSEEGGQPRKLAYGFVFDQTEPVRRLGYERMNMDDFAIFQMPIDEITAKTGITFDSSVLKADVLRGGGATESIRGFKVKRVTSLQGIVLR